jgi:hypothetical protein
VGSVRPALSFPFLTSFNLIMREGMYFIVIIVMTVIMTIVTIMTMNN